MNESLIKPYWALRIGLGASAFLAGLDKFFNILAQWDMYLSPIAGSLIPVDPALLMRVFGVVEMVVGATILFGATRLGAWVASVWLLAIAANLVTTGSFYDVAVRDVNMAIAAIVLARLDALRAPAREPLAIRASTQTT
ncbi:MAG: DoxX family membrane protein [Thermoanaerobaculia bacterium]|nr:DoxX family membrane protein [Thermoanaerobaculia bacterium]